MHGPPRRRANLNCDFFSNLWQIATGRNPCSSHCLNFDEDKWYYVRPGGTRSKGARLASRVSRARTAG